MPHLTVEEGKDIVLLMSLPILWIMGIVYFTSRSVFSLYIVNQAPVLQEINLPEAQGQIVSWNQFLESLGRGIAPLMAGILLVLTGMNYQLVVSLMVLCIIPGIVLWMLALRWFEADSHIIKEILSERAKILKERKNNSL